MKAAVFLLALTVLAVPTAGICRVHPPENTGKAGHHTPPMGSLGSGFPTAAGKHGASVGGPAIHGATINGTQTPRKH